MEQPDLIGEHKILGEVGRGACGVVYKAQSPGSDDVVALKLLQTDLSGTIVETLRFEREFRISAACDHPNLVKTFNYGSSNGQPFYTMELVDGVGFNTRFKDLPTSNERDAFAKVVDGILEALDHIHEKSIVHRDLKPENVLVTKANEPRILDFGLARPQYGDDAPRLTNPGTVLGTVHYLSPEQLSARPLDGRSDLFSIGTMVYEVLAGRLPFDADHPIGIFGQILSQPPQPLVLPPGYPPELEKLVMKLLEKDPSDRFQTAGEVLVAWRKVMFGVEEEAKIRQVQLPEQLYMPRFVGQTEALQAFQRVCGPSGPRILLVRGKAGAGKSRFLEEATSLAQAKGHSHQGARANTADSTPYQLWIPPLRQAFKRPKPAVMPLRSVLSALLPELGYTVHGATSKSQLFEAMARTLKVQRGLIWLDDVHLADSASLEFLHYLSRRIVLDDQLIVVASYNPDKPAKLLRQTRDALIGAEFAIECDLMPLSQEEVAMKVGSMLAGKVEVASSQLLHGETNGNPLYIGEAVKAALAEGRLRNHEGEWTLTPPTERSVASSVRDQLVRQLNSIQSEDRQVLKMAAMLGFDFDFEVLSKVSQIQKMELLDRILRVSDKGFLIESEEDSFRFGSRALHQVLLESIPDEEKPDLHQRVAQTLETLQPRSRWIVDIALHYEAAGCPENAVTHLLAAGAEASRTFAHEDALDYYQRALKVPADKRIAMPDDVIHEKIANARQGLGQFDEAEKQYVELLGRAAAAITKVRLRRKISECQQMLGKFQEAHVHLTEGLRLVGVGPDGKAQASAPMQWVQKLFPKLNNKFGSDEMMSHQLHRILDRQLSNLFFLRPPNWTQDVFKLASLQEDVAKKLGNAEPQAQAQIFLGFVELHHGRRESAIQHWEKGVSIASELRNSPYKALLIRNMGLMHLLAGNAVRAQELCAITQRISEQLSDRPGLTQAQMVLCAIELHWANFDKALEHAHAMLSTADDAGLPVFRALGWSYLARATAHNDHLAEAQQHLAKAEELAQKIKLPYVDMMVWIARAWVNCDLGKHAESDRAAHQGLEHCERIQSLPFYRLTLHCASLWAGVSGIACGNYIPGGGKARLLERLDKFKEESRFHGVIQFIDIADHLLVKLKTGV